MRDDGFNLDPVFAGVLRDGEAGDMDEHLRHVLGDGRIDRGAAGQRHPARRARKILGQRATGNLDAERG